MCGSIAIPFRAAPAVSDICVSNGVHSYIEFIAFNGGHIKVKGNIHNGNAYGYEQELIFENELDQTYLKSFVKDLFADFEKYVGR